MEKYISLGINDVGLQNLSYDFLTIADNVSVIFDKIEQNMEKLEEHLKCEATKDLNEKIETIKKIFPVIKRNIISYSDDMVLLNQKMSVGSKDLVNIVRNREQEIKNKQKEVE